MKEYTFEDMEERFGIGFRASVMGIEEVFIKLCYDWQDCTFYDTEEEAKQHLRDMWKVHYKAQVYRIEKIIAEYEALPLYKLVWSFIFKGGWKKNRIVKERMAQFDQELVANLAEVDSKEVTRLDRSDYVQKLPVLSVGDALFITVTSQNVLSVGVHKAIVKEVGYRLDYRDKNTLYCTAEALTDTKDCMTLRADNDGASYTTGYSYHKVWHGKQDAINFMLEYMESEKSKLDEQIKALGTISK